MHSGKVIYGLYDDDDKLLDATKTLVGKGYSINEIYSPLFVAPEGATNYLLAPRISKCSITNQLCTNLPD